MPVMGTKVLGYIKIDRNLLLCVSLKILPNEDHLQGTDVKLRVLGAIDFLIRLTRLI